MVLYINCSFLPCILSRWWRGWAQFFRICRSTVFHIKHKPFSAGFYALCSWEVSPLPSLGCLEARTHKIIWQQHNHRASVCYWYALSCSICVLSFVFKIWEMRHFQYEWAVCKHDCSPSVQLASDIPRSVNSLSANMAGGFRFPLWMESSLKKSQ